MFGSGFRANATIGRAIRLTAINAFGLRPHELDQATQGNPAKYTACIADEEQSPWPPFHVEHGFDVHASTVIAMTMRSVVHIEARHTTVPEQLALDLAGTISRTGALIHETVSALVVLGPEHAQLFARAWWSKGTWAGSSTTTRCAAAPTAAVGKDAIARQDPLADAVRSPRRDPGSGRRSGCRPRPDLGAGRPGRRCRRSQQRRVGSDRDLWAARRCAGDRTRRIGACFGLKVDPLTA